VSVALRGGDSFLAVSDSFVAGGKTFITLRGILSFDSFGISWYEFTRANILTCAGFCELIPGSRTLGGLGFLISMAANWCGSIGS
jgi:hypothetical protein